MTPFHWLEDATVSIAASNAGTDRVALKKMPTGKAQIRIYNSHTATIFIRKGVDANVTAGASDLPIAPGATEVLTLNNTEKSPITHVAAYVATSGGTIYFTTGAGI